MAELSKSARDARDVPITIAALREIGLFGALSDDVLDHLARRLRTSSVAPGDEIFREGDTFAREMYVVLEGEMEIFKRGRRKEVRIAILGPNDWFGEMSMIDMQPRSATVRALAPSRLLRVRSEDLDELYRSDLKSYTLIVLNIARGMSRRLRVIDAIAADSARSSQESRLIAQKP